MSEYKEELERMRWSFSRVHSYEDCPYKFYLGYIEKPIEVPESNYYAEVGKLMHDTLEKILKKELLVDDAADYFLRNYYETVLSKTRESAMESTLNACIDYLANENFDFLDNHEIVGVEKECKFQVGNYAFVGYIDLLLRNNETGKLEIWDHKSAKYPLKKNGDVLKSELNSFTAYKRQEYLYAYAIKQEYGEYPSSLNWNYFKAGKRVNIEFDIQECEEVIEWITNMIKEIEKDEIFPPKMSYMQCNILCGYRSCCDYRKIGGD